MSHFERLILTLAVIFASLALGWICRRLCETGSLPLSLAKLDAGRNAMQTAAIYVLLPLAAMLSLWGIPKPDPAFLALPLLGLASYICGGTLALLGARMLKLSRIQTGSFFCCGAFTNIGAVGGLVCLLFLGENSIAFVALYRLVEEAYYFSVAFPVAKWYGPDNKSADIGFRAFKLSPVLVIIVCALVLGIVLNFLEIPRPAFCGPLASLSMFAATVLLLFAIGLTLRLSRVWGYSRSSLVLCAIKFIALPLIIVPLAACMGYGNYDGGLPLKTAAILSCMPVAMTALVPPALFGLDVDLANACWIFSTAGLVVVLPALMAILPAL